MSRTTAFIALLACSLLLAAAVSASSHEAYSSPRAGFSTADGVSVDDTAVYNTGYVSENGSNWTAITLTGQKERGNWVLGQASSDASLQGIRYVAIFSCTWSSGWDCSQTWQVRDRGPQQISGDAVVFPDTTRDITPTGATIRAEVRDFGSADQAQVWLEWRRIGDTDWTSTPERTQDTGWPFTQEIQGLAPETEYEYRGYARTSEGTSQSMTQTFRTHKQVTSGSVAQDHAALMDFYQATGGDSWSDNSGWGGSADTMGSWTGVTTYSSGPDTGRVKEIRLKDNNLVGEIPESFGDLSKLTHLRVKGNSLTGPIDTFICDLESARWLSFSSFTSVNGQQDRDIDDYVRFNHEGKNGDGQNGFTGSLPECIQDMTSLRMLEVAASHLSGELPARLPPNINALFIQSNDMSGPLPPAWGEASALTHLFINQNFRDAKYTGPIPPEWNGMQQMRWFSFKGNTLDGPLPYMDKWHDVRLFAGGGGSVYGGEFPFWLMTDRNKHRSLHTLELGGTGFTGQLPEYVSPYFDPSTFSIMDNDLTGPIPQWFEDQFKGVIQILWTGNSFSGPFPDVSDFSELRFISVSGNEFSGSLPEIDPTNPTLNIVGFHNNNFNGTIPESWGQVVDGVFERGMRIPGNNIEGKIPRRLGEVVKNRFDIENNKFVFADMIEVVQMLRDDPEVGTRAINHAPQKPFGWAETVTVAEGGTFTYDFSGKSHPDDTYQWTKDGVAVSGQTSPILTISNVQASDAGDYRLEIDNPFGDVVEHHDDGDTLGTLVSEPITLQVTQATTDSVQGDYDALMALYDATNGDSWDNNDGWGGSADTMGSWYGVETDGDGRVISVKLNGNTGWDIEYFKGEDGVQGGNNLDGTLPAELGNLKRVRYFNVKQNQLSGELPPEIGNMESLEVLLLNGRTWDPEPGVRKHHNGKSSTDGGAGIDEKTNLYSGSIPASFGDLSNLRVLELIGQREDTDTGVEGPIPPELGQLSNLEALHLAFNELSGELPDEIYGMENLIAIDIGRNMLEGPIPASINETWENMVYMSLCCNRFSGELPELSNLRNLKYFGVKGNDLNGSLAWMEDVNWTQELSFTFDFNDDYYDDSAGFTGQVPDLETLSGATTLRFQGNKLTGEIPDSVTGMWRVIILTFAWNNLTGELPQTGWEGFTNQLRHLTMNTNRLTGNIPGNLIENADNPNLQNLRFSNNDFTSMDVDAADNLQNGEIQIGNNKLTFKDFVTSDGRIPSRVSGHTSQKPFGNSRTINANSGSDVTINDFEANLQHADNSYQWTLDGSAISGANSKTLALNNVDSSDAGEYVLQVTNSNVGGLTLESEPVTLTVS